MRGIRFLAAAGLAAGVLLLSAGAAAAQPVCDPYATQLDPAAIAIQNADYAGATSIINNVARSPAAQRDFHVRLLRNTIAVRQSAANGQAKRNALGAQQFSAAIDALKMQAREIPKMDAGCVAAQDFNKIYNEIGFQYMNAAQFAPAECFLLKAYLIYEGNPQSNKLTRIANLQNLGFFYYLQQNFALSRDYYLEAQKLGDTSKTNALNGSAWLLKVGATNGPSARDREKGACAKAGEPA